MALESVFAGSHYDAHDLESRWFDSPADAEAWMVQIFQDYRDRNQDVWVWLCHNGAYVPGHWKWFALQCPPGWETPSQRSLRLGYEAWQEKLRQDKINYIAEVKAKRELAKKNRKTLAERRQDKADREKFQSDSIVSNS